MRLILSVCLLFVSCATTDTTYSSVGQAPSPPPVTLFEAPVSMPSIYNAVLSMSKQPGAVRRLYINSRGGDMNAAKLMTKYFALLKSKDIKVVCYAGPEVMSAAYYIYLHCDQRYATMDSLLFPHKIHIWFSEPVLPEVLLEAGTEAKEEQDAWDKEAMEITGINKKDYLEFRDSDEHMWPMAKVLQKSKKKWLTIVPSYNFNFK